MTVQEVLDKTKKYFSERGIESSRLEAEVLLAGALGWPRIDLYSKYDTPLKLLEIEKCREFVARKGKGEPTAYILGEKEFYSHSFLVSPGVLIPRPETEHLVEKAIEHIRKESAPVYLLDLGCGSGCIGLSVLKECENVKLLSYDFSEPAIKMTLENAERLGVADRVQVVEADVSQLSREQIIADFGNIPNIILANPPYIAKGDPNVAEGVKKYEPDVALFSGESGLESLHSWAKLASSCLENSGIFICEVGHKQAAEYSKYLMEQKLFSESNIYSDLAGIERVVEARRG